MMLRIAAFDVDGTLTRRDCVVPFLRRVAGISPIALSLARSARSTVPAAMRRDRDLLKAAATRAAFTGRRRADVEALAEVFALEVADSWLREDTVADLRRHRDAGDVTVMVSASYGVYLRPLGALLGVDAVLATEIAADDGGRYTGELAVPNCRGPEKVRRLHDWLDAHHGGRGGVHLTAYGDSPGDRDLLGDADVARWVG